MGEGTKPNRRSKIARGASRGRARLVAVVAIVAILLVGGLIVAAPMLAASVVNGTISGSYSDSIRGSARADRVTVGWFGPIRVEGLVLEDASGSRIATADVRAEIGLLGVIAGSTDFGEIRLSGEADVRAGGGGTTDLERALEPVDPDAGGAPAGPLIAPGTRARVVLEPTDVRYTDTRLPGMTEGRVGTVMIGGATGTVRIEPGSPVTIELDAPLRTRGPNAGEGSDGAEDGSATGTLTADLEADVPEGATGPGEIAVSGTVSLAGLPTALIDAIAGARGTINGVLGEDVGVEITADDLSSSGGTLAIDADSPQAALRYRGEVRAAGGGGASLVATEDTVLSISGIAERFGARAAGLVPLFASFQKDPSTHDPAELRLTRLEIPLDSDPVRAVLAGVIEPGRASYSFTRPLAALLSVADVDPAGSIGGRIGLLRLSMSEGVLRYSELEVPVGEYMFTSEAAFDLLNGTEDITINVPAGAIAEDATGGLGSAFDRIAGDTMVPIYRRGPIGENNPLRPDFSSVLEDALGPGGALQDRLRKGIDELIPPAVREGLPGGGEDDDRGGGDDTDQGDDTEAGGADESLEDRVREGIEELIPPDIREALPGGGGEDEAAGDGSSQEDRPARDVEALTRSEVRTLLSRLPVLPGFPALPRVPSGDGEENGEDESTKDQIEDRIREGIEGLIPPDAGRGLPDLPGLPGGGGGG